MSFMLSPRWFALDSRGFPRRLRAKERRRNRLALLVTPLEERQLLTTPTLISVAASASNLVFGQAEVLTATVDSNPPGTNIPTGGMVMFQNGTNVLGTATLSNGSASLSTVLPAGTYSVSATYSGTAAYGASTSTTSAGYIFNVAGNGTYGNTVTPTGVPASSAWLANPYGVAVGPRGTVYIADTFNNEIDAVNPITGTISVIAGNGTAGYVDGSASSAEFYRPMGLAFDAQLNALFIADRDNNIIRELNLGSSQVTTVAGTPPPVGSAPTTGGQPNAGFTGDGGSATSAELYGPRAVAVGPTGSTLFIADTFNNVIRAVNLLNGIIITVAGTPPPAGPAPAGAQPNSGYTGNGGPATSAELSNPSGVALDSAGNLYIGDAGNFVVRKVTASTQVITTIAGTGTYGYSGNNGPATSAELGSTYGVALNAAGTTLYIADGDNNAIREVNLPTGIITTVAGNGTFGLSGNNGPATSATLGSPRSVAVDASGNVYIADTLGGTNPQGTGGSIRLLAAGAGTASVTVEPFASIAPGNTRVFMMGVPTGVGRRTAQGIVLALANITNANSARLASNYFLSTPPNGAGKVKKIRLNRVAFDAANNIVRIFPRTRLNAHKTYRLIIYGQPVGPVTLFFNRASIISETV
jgi:sugar lactone lactonase YvrE